MAKKPNVPPLAEQLKKAEGLRGKFPNQKGVSESQAVLAGLQLYGLVQSGRSALRNPIHKNGVRVDVLQLDAIGFEILRVLGKPYLKFAHADARECGRLLKALKDATEKGQAPFGHALKLGIGFGALQVMCGPIGAAYLAHRGLSAGEVNSREGRKGRAEEARIGKEDEIKLAIKKWFRTAGLNCEKLSRDDRRHIVKHLKAKGLIYIQGESKPETKGDHYEEERAKRFITPAWNEWKSARNLK
jgi:hypothetical protein